MTGTTVDLAELASRVRMALFPLTRQLRHQNLDLTATQASALATISRCEPLTVGDLAKAEHVSSPMITKVVKGLEDAGLVRKDVDPVDRRVARLTITRDGTRRLERSRTRKNAWLAKRLRVLDADELAVLEAAIPVFEKLAGVAPE
ncbi:MAG TPA: MarR family transcriptional regulator [Acidimicrobiales bacterium]